MHRKAALIEQWLRSNNIAIKNEINNCKDENKYNDIKMSLDVMVSVLIGENVTKGSNFYAIENLVGTDNPTINFIRKASFEELYNELRLSSDESGIKTNMSLLNPNKIIDLYEEKKARGEVTTSGYEDVKREANKTQNTSYEQKNQNNNQYNNLGKDNSFNSNLYNQTQAKENYNTYETQHSYSYENSTSKGILDGRDMVEACGNSLDCNINGVRVVIIPNENGDYTVRNHESYSQSMEIKFNGGRDSQIVNKKTLTREEFNSFIERYENEIFNADYSYQKTYLKENTKGMNREY